MISSKSLGSEVLRPASPVHSGVGRPRKQTGNAKIVHDALLVAVEECLVAEESTRVPVRQIAEKAGVNQAMVYYYFSSKSGLISALLDKQFSQLLRDLKMFLKEVSTSDGAEAADHNYIADLIALVDKNFSSSPALFVIMHSNMVDKNSDTRKNYRERHSARGYSIIVRIMKTLMKRGLCRDDITPDHAAYITCCVSAMPYLLSPIFHASFESEIGGKSAEYRRQAAAQLFKPPQALGLAG